MFTSNKSFIFRFFSVFISLLLFFNLGLIVDAQTQNPQSQKFVKAKGQFFSQDYKGAKENLEVLVSELSTSEGQDTLKGNTYLFLGAANEKLGNKNLSIKYFCKAKQILGDNVEYEGLDLSTYKYFKSNCEGVLIFIQSYDEAYNAYFAKKYDTSKIILEKLVAQVDQVTGLDSFKGETYLLSGATYEKLKYKKLAIKYYCKAKEILGKGKTIAGLVLKKLKWYKKKCASGVVERIGRKKRSGGILGTLLGLAVLGAAVWYLFINENSPLKKNDDEGSGGDSKSQLYSKYKFSTTWSMDIDATCSNANTCSVSWSPDPNWYPTPNNSNNWDGTNKINFSSSANIKSLTIALEFKVSGCNNGTRKDTVYINGNKVLEKTNTFNNNCDTNAMNAAAKNYKIHSQSTTKSITMRHVLQIDGLTVSDVTTRGIVKTN